MINLLIGTQRIPLRNACLRQMAELTARWPDRRAILIVPEQTKMDMEREFLEIAKQPGLMLAEVLSFRRLAWRLAGEVGSWPTQAVDAVGQAMLIQKILKQRRQELRLLGDLGEKPGYIRQIASVLGDLRRYQVDPAILLRAEEKIADASLRFKAADLGLILQAYEQALEQAGLSDAEEDLARLAGLLETLASREPEKWPWNRLAWLKNTSIWINGFGELRDFTPQEERIMRYLGQLARDLTISVAADHMPLSSQAVNSGPDMYYIGRKAAWRLRRNLPLSKVSEVDCRLKQEFALISDRLCGQIRENPPTDANNSGQIGVKLVRTTREDIEISWVAGEIRRLVQTEGLRYRDIAIAACDLKKTAPLLRSVFRTYSIPLFLDQDSLLAGTPLMRLVLGLLDIGLSGWSRWPVMSFLRSGLVRSTAARIDELENIMLARGLFREDRLFADQRLEEDDGGGLVLEMRDQILLPVRNLLCELKQKKSALQKCSALQRYLHDAEIPELIEARSAWLMEQGEAESAVNLAKSWNELDRIFRQMVQLAGDVSLSFRAFRDLLAVAVETARSGIIPTAVDQVNVGDLRRGFLQSPQVLFIVGATADKLPPAWPPEGLLKDPDRQVLSSILDFQLPSHGRDQACSDGFLIYTLLTMPRKQLYISVSGSEVSPWYNYLADLFPGTELILPTRPDWHDSRLNCAPAAFSHYLIHRSELSFRDGNTRQSQGGWNAVRDILLADGLPLEQAEEMLGRGMDEKNIVRLEPERVRRFYGDTVGMSVSQLERYAGCPFLHLAGYLLDLQERAVWEPEKTDTGILLHSGVELAFRELLQDLAAAGEDPEKIKEIYKSWLVSDLEARTDSWLRQAANSSSLQRILEQGLRASAGRRTRRLACTSLRNMLDQLLNDEYLPAQLEWSFGQNETSKLRLSLADKSQVDFRGKIDRVDLALTADKVCFRVIDYKSGNRYIDYDAFYHGLSLQLPMYLEAYAREYPTFAAADAAYYYFDRPMISIDPQESIEEEKIARKLAGKAKLRNLNLEAAELAGLRNHAWRQAEKLATGLTAGRFDVSPARLPGKNPPCSWCAYLSVCGFHKLPANYRWLQPVNQICGSNPGQKKREAFFQCLTEENRE